MTARRRLGILISGRGSNMAALLEAAAGAEYPAEPVVVISNRPGAAGLALAREAGVEAVAIDHRAYPDKVAFEAALDGALAERGVDLVALAGFMRVLSGAFTRRWAGRLVNVHPSLLPAYRGLDTHARALADGARVAGCSVHFVAADVDAGPVIAQAVVPVLPGDDAEALQQRVLAAEHALYPHAIALVASGRVALASDGVDFGDVAFDPAARLVTPPAS